MMPSVAWEMDLGIVAYHSMKASFDAIASKRHEMLGISEKSIAAKTFNFKSQTEAILNPLDVSTTPSKNHYYSMLSVYGTSIT